MVYSVQWFLTFILMINVAVTIGLWLKLVELQIQIAETHSLLSIVGSSLVKVGAVAGGSVADYLKNKFGV